MRKYIKIFLPVFALALLCFLSYKVWEKINYKNEGAQNTEMLPNFSYQNIKGSNFIKQDLDKNLPTIFFYFNSECDYCQHDAREIQQNIASLNNIELLFISTEDPEKIEGFALTHKLDIYDNIYFLYDERGHFSRTFDANTVPFLAIYNKDNQLVKKIKGQAKVANILAALEQDNP